MNRDELRRLAGSATAGKWDWHCAKHDDGRNNGSVLVGADTGRAVCLFKAPQYAPDEQWRANAAYAAAANPATILELLDTVDELVGALEKCREHADGNGYILLAVDDALAKAKGE